MNEMDRIIEQKRLIPEKYIWIGVIGFTVLLLFIKILFGDNSMKMNVDTGKIDIETVRSKVFKEYITVAGTLKVAKAEKALIIPRGGFIQSTGGQWIFVLDEKGHKAVKRNIKLGRQNYNYYEVLEGLHPGEQVIISNYENFGAADQLILKDQ